MYTVQRITIRGHADTALLFHMIGDSAAQQQVCAYRWLGKRGGGQAMLEGSRSDPRPPMHSYLVTIITSDIRNAGTDADVFVDIKGQHSLLRPHCSPFAAQASLLKALPFLQRLCRLG